MSQQRYEYEVMRELEQEQAQIGYMENMVCMNEDRLKALRESGL
jgi:hypothetical protein